MIELILFVGFWFNTSLLMGQTDIKRTWRLLTAILGDWKDMQQGPWEKPLGDDAMGISMDIHGHPWTPVNAQRECPTCWQCKRLCIYLPIIAYLLIYPSTSQAISVKLYQGPKDFPVAKIITQLHKLRNCEPALGQRCCALRSAWQVFSEAWLLMSEDKWKFIRNKSHVACWGKPWGQHKIM